MPLAPRAVVVTRPTELDELLARHGTLRQARFYLEQRGGNLDLLQERHETSQRAIDRVLGAIPLDWRRACVDRTDLNRFLFGPEDVVLAVGQDGLVANVAKYLDGQVVVGVNPGLYDGVLVPHSPDDARDLMVAAAGGAGRIEERSLIEAKTSDGQRLLALNEIFIGHRTHQSARYTLRFAEQHERHSSSGIIVATGTGATGWACSIARERRTEIELPARTSRDLVFFVREAFPSKATGVLLTEGRIDSERALEVVSEMNAGGVVFGDGIEDDRLDFHFGRSIRVTAAATALRLSVGL